MATIEAKKTGLRQSSRAMKIFTPFSSSDKLQALLSLIVRQGDAGAVSKREGG
jgi:hypothetical protein